VQEADPDHEQEQQAGGERRLHDRERRQQQRARLECPSEGDEQRPEEPAAAGGEAPQQR
jgi:hypothetical protein